MEAAARVAATKAAAEGAQRQQEAEAAIAAPTVWAEPSKDLAGLHATSRTTALSSAHACMGASVDAVVTRWRQVERHTEACERRLVDDVRDLDWVAGQQAEVVGYRECAT